MAAIARQLGVKIQTVSGVLRGIGGSASIMAAAEARAREILQEEQGQ